MTYLYLGILLGTLGWTFLRGRDILSPARVFICLYAFLMAVYSLGLSRYQTPWSSTTQLLFWGGTGMFLAGCLLVRLLDAITFPGQRIQLGDVREALARDAVEIDWRWYFTVYMTMAIIFVGCYSYNVLKTGMIPAFSRNPDASRLEFLRDNAVIGLGWNAALFSMTMAVELVLFGRMSRRRMVVTVVTAAVVLVAFLTLLMRLDIFRALVFGTLLYHYGRRSLSVKAILMLTSLSLVLFIVFMLARVNAYTMMTLSASVTQRIPHGFEWASGIYVYLAGNFWNLDYALRRYEEGPWCYPQSWGYELFRPVLFLLRLERPLLQSYGFDTGYNESIVKTAVSNSVVYVWHFYKDFGVFGVLLISLVFGFGLSLYHANMLRRATLKRVSVLGVLMGTLVFSYMVPLWGSWATWGNVLVLVFAHRKKSRK